MTEGMILDCNKKISPNKLEGIKNQSDKKKCASFIALDKEKNHIFDIALPEVKLQDIQLGKILGEGGFCSVYEIESIRPIKEKDSNSCSDATINTVDSIDEHEPPLSVASDLTSFYSENSIGIVNKPLVAKKLKENIKKNNFKRALTDLSNELKLLSRLSQKNIIKARGYSIDNSDGILTYIILERIYKKMDDKLKYWAKRAKKTKSILGVEGFCGRNNLAANQLLIERVSCAFEISTAIEYIHSKDIIFRDLKPENIGFDAKGIVKIFDFGLCIELQPAKLSSKKRFSKEKNLYMLSKMVGSVPYMSPEVYLGKPYNCLSDVYSFAFLLYQMIFLKPLFPYFGRNDYKNKVYKGDMRPNVQTHTCSERMLELLKRSWCSEISKRMSMLQVSQILQEELNKIKCIN